MYNIFLVKEARILEVVVAEVIVFVNIALCTYTIY